MARPLRIEFDGAVYHIMARGNAGDDIFRDDDDRAEFLSVLAEVCEGFDWRVLCYCLMANHIHLVIATDRATLSRGMRQVLGVYSQRFNRRHGRYGHVFQGRYKALLVETSAYLIQLCAYVLRNPVAAGLVSGAKQWPWSSYGLNSGRNGRTGSILRLCGASWGRMKPERAGRLRRSCAKTSRRPRPAASSVTAAMRLPPGWQKAAALSPEHPRRTRAALSPA